MRKLMIAALLIVSSFSFAEDSPAVPEGCVISPSTKGQTVIQCDKFVTIKEPDKVTVCNLGEAGTKPVCQEIPKGTPDN